MLRPLNALPLLAALALAPATPALAQADDIAAAFARLTTLCEAAEADPRSLLEKTENREAVVTRDGTLMQLAEAVSMGDQANAGTIMAFATRYPGGLSLSCNLSFFGQGDADSVQHLTALVEEYARARLGDDILMLGGDVTRPAQILFPDSEGAAHVITAADAGFPPPLVIQMQTDGMLGVALFHQIPTE